MQCLNLQFIKSISSKTLHFDCIKFLSLARRNGSSISISGILLARFVVSVFLFEGRFWLLIHLMGRSSEGNYKMEPLPEKQKSFKYSKDVENAFYFSFKKSLFCLWSLLPTKFCFIKNLFCFLKVKTKLMLRPSPNPRETRYSSLWKEKETFCPVF